MIKSDIKKKLLKELKSGMTEMKREGKKDYMKMPEAEAKVTVMSDSEEGLKEGLSKAQQILAAKKKSKSKESEECDICSKSPCDCD